jgi:hypothetical protein
MFYGLSETHFGANAGSLTSLDGVRRKNWGGREHFLENMPRAARLGFPGVPHHSTQRCTARGTTFFTNSDRRVYLELLAHHSDGSGLLGQVCYP